MSENFQIDILSRHLSNFDFRQLFIELGWSNPASDKAYDFIVAGETFTRKQISQLSGAVVFEINSADGKIPEKNFLAKIQHEITKLHRENVLIFVDVSRTNSLWYWTKFENKKKYSREHLFIKGQPVDLMLGKIMALNFDIADFDEDGNVPIISVAKKLQKALDIEKTVKKFFTEFQVEHTRFLEFIEGIENERDKKWYVSVILNRLMFIYFLQKKFFIDNDQDYLQNKLAQTKAKGSNLFYRDFLNKLFFVGFAKPEIDRHPNEKQLLGDVPYLNGGLFLKHRIELEEKYNIQIADEAFENLFALFGRYSWHLDDTPSGKPDEMNPDVLGYIFEKYINQKAFGAYYTRPEITGYLCEQTIYKLILDKVNSLAKPADGLTPNMFSSNDGGLFLNRTFASISDLLLNLDEFLCDKLWHDILPSLKLLDPACGSGAFLVAALKTLLNVYSAVIGRIEIIGGKLNDELNEIRQEHAFNYHLKKLIISNNLFGVDIMEEATEIAKLRLFMNLVSSVKERRQLEPLPNIDFNILAGNSLIGILNVKGEDFNKVENPQASLFADEVSQTYQQILKDKEQSIKLYKEHSFNDEETDGLLDKSTRLLQLREHIEKIRHDSYEKLNELLLGDFNDLKIKFEAANWDAEKNKLGKPTKRDLTKQDITALQPFHWGFEFPEVFKQGGFDAIITNPPWEIFKPQDKEFFAPYSESVKKNTQSIKSFEREKVQLLEDTEISKLYLAYLNQYPHQSNFFRYSATFKNQISIIDGKKAGSDINLYKLFVEQCYNLLHSDGYCGIVIPSGIYTDLGTKQLRQMLLNDSEIIGLVSLSNERYLFEGVMHNFKFCLLTYKKGKPKDFIKAAFKIYVHEAISPLELDAFLNNDNERLNIPIQTIKKFAPTSLSIMEFKKQIDLDVVNKLIQFSMLGDELSNSWNFKLFREFDMTGSSHLFEESKLDGCFVLYEGKMIHQFTHLFGSPQYWVNEKKARESLLPRNELDKGQKLDYQDYRIGIRAIGGSANERGLISTILPKDVFCGNSILVSTTKGIKNSVNNKEKLLLLGFLNSFVVDYCIRQMVATNINMFYIYQLHIPRLKEDSDFYPQIIERVVKLICTTEEYADLWQEVTKTVWSEELAKSFVAHHQKLRAELDGIIANIYGLSESEFAYILTTFPVVSDVVKVATQNAFRDVERGLIK
jgi:hypothetical protein